MTDTPKSIEDAPGLLKEKWCDPDCCEDHAADTDTATEMAAEVIRKERDSIIIQQILAEIDT